jgi:hypothetical protein
MAPHWTCRLAATLLLLSGLSGCSEDLPPTACSGEPPPLSLFTPQPGIVRAGAPARLHVMPSVTFSCSGGITSQPTSATAEVEGPEGHPLESRIELGLPGSPTIVEFTPDRPGPHHVIVVFSETGGLHQFDLHAAQDRSAEAPSQPLSVTCGSLERTLQGAWICDSSILRGDRVLSSFSGARLAVAGDVIWVVTSASIRRYVDTGTEIVLTGSFSHQRSGAEFLLASPDELIVLHTFLLGSYSFSGGVLTSPGTRTVERPSGAIMPGSPYGVLVREGDRLALASRTRIGNTSAVQVCSYLLSSGKFEPVTGACPVQPGEISGFEPGILWTKDPSVSGSEVPNQGLLRRWRWTGGQLVEQGSLALGIHTSLFERPLLRSAAVPVLRNISPSQDIPQAFSVVTWSSQRKMLLLEHLDAEVADALASPTLFWGKLSSTPAVTPTRVRLRPPPL